MNEPLTPIFRFPDDSPFRNIFIKREDLSETGSHKFRYLKSQMKALKEQVIQRVVLSTTGNVGISASHYGKKLGIEVVCLMSDKGDMDRAAQVEKEGGLLILSSRPKRFAQYLSRKYEVPLLRASREEDSLEGYRSLGQELIHQVPDAQAVVNFATSGTSSMGLLKAYEGKRSPALHIVHDEDHSIVRGEELAELVEQSGGAFHTVSKGEQEAAEKTLAEYGLETSYEGIASFAAALKIMDRYSSIVVIFSGKKWPAAEITSKYKANTLEEVDKLFVVTSAGSVHAFRPE